MTATATAPPAVPSAFDALVCALARGDSVDAELVEAIAAAHGRTMRDLAEAVAARAAAGDA